MSDFIGRITVPTPTASGLVFPLTTDFGYGMSRSFSTVTHRFGELATLGTQSFYVGIGPRKFSFKRSVLSPSDRNKLVNFFEAVEGGFQTFNYNAPNETQTFDPYLVTFDQAPLSLQDFINRCQTGITFVEVPDPASAPIYNVADTLLRFPSEDMAMALTSQVQQIIPLVHIRVREAAVPDIYLSDQRVTIGGQLYLPRLLNIGQQGSDVIMSQSISGQADQVSFTFGNADRVMTKLCNDTDLKYATIDLSLYHVQTAKILQLWKGSIISFVSDGSPTFPVQCSDGLYQVTQQYPIRTNSRTCWKTFNDGINCPWSSVSGIGNPTSCDYYFDSPNGCESHGMANTSVGTGYFGGMPANPQGVVLKDNSTGVFGIGRNNVTATSIVSDTMWGNALAEIYCNDDSETGYDNTALLNAFVTNATIVDVRDEGDYFDVLGIVGQGPLGRFTPSGVATNADGFKYVVAPLADGFPPQGFRVDGNLNVTRNESTVGLRQVVGNDPATLSSDFFSLSQLSGTGVPGLPSGFGNAPNDQSIAAGTAFVELRYAKPSGFQPSATDAHSMTVPIGLGLGGYVWDAAGNRSFVQGLTNPAWIAVNVYLKALGLFFADSATQLNTFVLSSINAGDGSGAAEICDLQAPVLLGTGTEKQFRFQGILGSQKPCRDWLTEILSCCLGWYTFEFGRLKIGIRENASDVSAFTLGNMLYQSLRLAPIEATFEHLVIDFADQAYQYQANTADYQDKDHAAYYGRAGSPLTARMHSVGLSTLNQALLVAATRTREEVGGVNATEWAAARQASWKTTVLALDTEVGQVVAIQHPDIPSNPEGFGKFRITGWRLMKDWSIEITAKTVTNSMYDLEVGPKPADVLPQPLPVLFYPIPQGEWQPMKVQASAADTTWPNQFSFDVAESYQTLADNTMSPSITATGLMPVNSFIPNMGAPSITAGGMVQDTTSGSIAGGKTYRVAVCGIDQNNRLTPPSEVILVQFDPGSDNNAFTIEDIEWPQADGLVGYVLFASDNDDLICAQQTGTLTGLGGAYLPTSITVNGPFVESSWALPNPNIAKVRIKAKIIAGPGVIGGLVESTDSDNNRFTSNIIDPSGTDNWTGRRLYAAGRFKGSCPYASWTVINYDPLTGTFTLDRSLDVPGHPERSLVAGDAFVVAYQGYNTLTTPIGDSGLPNPYVFADGGIPNSQNYPTGIPFTGLVPGSNVGNVLRVIGGTGFGQTAKVIDNDASSYTLDTAVTLDTDSIVIIENPTWDYTSDSTPIDNATYNIPVSITCPIQNYSGQGILVAAFTVLKDGTESENGDGPCRPIYIFGAGYSVERAPYPWMPNTAQPNETSFQNQTELTYTMQVSYRVTGDVISEVDITLVGDAPENVFSPLAPMVLSSTTNTVFATGFIPGPVDLDFVMCAVDANGLRTDPGEPVTISLPNALNSIQLDMTNVVYPSTAVKWEIYGGPRDHMTLQTFGGAPPTNDQTVLVGPLNVAEQGTPDSSFDHFRVNGKVLTIGAAGGAGIVDVVGTQVTLGSGGVPLTGFNGNYTGMRVFLAGKADLSVIQFRDWEIVSNIGTILTLSEDVSADLAPGDFVGFYLPGDTSGTNYIGFSGFAGGGDSFLHPFTPNALIGQMVHIIAGTGRWQTRLIVQNTESLITVNEPWDVIPDATSYFVIGQPTWSFSNDSPPITQGNPLASISLPINVSNLQEQGLLIEVETVAADANVSVENPQRLIYLQRIVDPGEPNFLGMIEASFNFGLGGDGGWADVAVGDKTPSPQAKIGGTFQGYTINAPVAPVGADMQFDVFLIAAGQDASTATSIFGPDGPYPTLPDGQQNAVGFVFAGIQQINPGDRLYGQVLRVGSSTPGQAATLQVYFL